MTRPRRDPRLEKALRHVGGNIRPRFTLQAAPIYEPANYSGGRSRRDPRQEHRRLLVPGTVRPRLDRTRHGDALEPLAQAAVTEAAPRLRTVLQPAFLVAVVPDAPDGRLTLQDRQLFGAAHLLADGGGAVLALVPPSVEELGRVGADRVGLLAITESYDPEAKTLLIAKALTELKVRHTLFNESAEGADLARRVAALLDEPLFAGAESLSAKAVTRPARAGRVEQRRVPPRLISLAADSALTYAGDPCEALHAELPAPPQHAPSAILSARIIPADPAAIALGEADFVLSAGNGVTDIPAFLQLAAALRATPGASRMLCDAGQMPRTAQVGASGTVLDATCYIALGIAGAPQHLQGMAKCEHVVAVNTDLHAAMVERAGLAIIADAQEVMPALLQALDAMRNDAAEEGAS